MFKNRHYSEEKRSRLFDERPFINGRLPKMVLAWMFGMQMWAGYFLMHSHSKNQTL